MGRAGSGLQSALAGEARVPAGVGGRKRSCGGRERARGAGRGCFGAARRKPRGAGVSESRGWSAGRFCATVHCAPSALAARRRLRDPPGVCGAPDRAEESGLGKQTLREEPGSSGRAQGPRAWRWGAEAPEGAPQRWATWRAPREARANRLQSRCCRRPARCRCLSPVSWKRGSPWCW